MKVILLRDVAGVGEKGDLKNVADGHALNFLLPRKFAVEATQQAIKDAERMNAQKSAAKEEVNKYFEIIKSGLEGKILNIKKRADEKGGLYAALSAQDVLLSMNTVKAHEIKQINRAMIYFSEPIKTIGIHDEAFLKIDSKEIPIKIEVIAESKK